MDYVDTIQTKLEYIISELEKLYDVILNNDYGGDILKLTKPVHMLDDQDKFFLQIGQDVIKVRLMYDKVVEERIVYKADLIEVNDLYQKYKSYF